MQNAVFCTRYSTHLMHTPAYGTITDTMSDIYVCTRKSPVKASGRMDFLSDALLQHQAKSGRKQNLYLACIMAYRNNR